MPTHNGSVPPPDRSNRLLAILYSFRRCPYAIRARMAIAQAAIAVELREVSLRDKPASMLALSAKATVPVLQCADGRVIDESLDIMRWALYQSDPHGWLRHERRADLDNLLALNDGPFKQALDRYKYAQRDAGFSQADYREQAESALIGELETRLAQQDFIGGDAPCLVDVAIFPFVRQFAAVDADWFDRSAWHGTRRWLRHWLASPLFGSTMEKRAVWSPGQQPLIFDPSRHQ